VDEKELILKVRAGDREAFGDLVKKYQKRIFATVYRLLRNYEDAAEITQDAFVCAYQAIKGFRLRSSFYTWLYRIAINLCYHRLRSKQYRIKLKTESLEELVETENGQVFKEVAISESDSPSQALITKEQIELIYQAIGSLKRKFYQALVLHDLEGLSYKEISQIQNCPIGTVMSRLHRARIQLAKNLRLTCSTS
jgi:RNA polymerase sigma-70 factor (ECF subfamily)